MTRVLVVDAHPVVIAGYKRFLSKEPRILCIGEASTGREALRQLARHRWDLLLLEMNLSDLNAADILSQVTVNYPNIRVLITSSLPEQQYAPRLLQAGASGYLSKGASEKEALKAVRAALNGRRYVSEHLAETMAGELETGRDLSQPLHSYLSPREFHVMCRLGTGAGVFEIANELGLSIKTVSTYRTRLLDKMYLQTNADITVYTIRHGLI